MLGLIRKFAQWPWPLLRRTEEEVSDTWVQFRTQAKDSINEVTEVPLLLAGTATLSEDKITARPASSDNWMGTHPITFADNEDFYIRVTVKPDEPLSTHVNMPILGVYETTDDIRTAWCIFQGGPAHPSRVGCIFFLYKTNDGRIVTLADTEVITYTNTTTVEVTRVNGTMYLFVNGTLRAQLAESKGNYKASTIPLRAFKIASNWTTSIMAGEIHDIRIAKSGVDYPSADHTIGSIPSYVRPEYDTNVADQIVAQYGFRRNSLEDEAGNGTCQLFGTAKVEQGRIVTTNANTSRYSFPCDYFGEGDFTIEFMCNVSAVSGTQVMLLGQYFRGAANIDPDDSWNIQWNSSDGIQFIYYDGTEKKGVGLSASAAPKNKDCHVAVVRYDGVLYVYVDGVKTSQREFSAALRKPVTNTVTSFYKDSTITTLFGARSIWNIRIAKRALYKDEFPVKPTYPAMPARFVWATRQYTFIDNTLMDEVTGHEMTRSSTSVNLNLDGGKLWTGNAASHLVSFPTFWCNANEDFTIELNFNAKSVASTGGALLCVWNATSLAENGWIITLNANRTLSFVVATANAANSTQTMTTTATISFLQDYHVAVVRVGSTVTLYLNGAPVATMQFVGALLKSTRPTSTSWGSSSGFIEGHRWGIRLSRGESKYTSAFTPNLLVPFYRPTYTKSQQAGILHQLTFRENLNLDEITGISPAVSQLNTTITRGRIVTTNSSSSYYSIPVSYFGAADFTMECNFRLTGSPVTHVDLMSHWHNGSVANIHNRYIIRVLQERRIQVIFSLSSALGDYTSRTSTVTVDVSRDYHLVIERVNGVITVYLDSVSIMSWSQPAALWATEGNFIEGYSRGTTGYGPREVTNIRIASKALYNGAIPFRSTFPQTLNTVGMSGTSAVQVLAAAPKNKILSDQSTQTTVQVLEKKAPNRILSDQSTQTIIQILVKK